MEIKEWYFGFHTPANPKDLLEGASIWSTLGHVEAFGYTDDQNWVSFDPRANYTRIAALHRHDDVDVFLTSRFTICREILVTNHNGQIRFPLHFHMNCVTQCASLVGIRAFTPRTFRRKLLKTGARIVQ